MLATDLPMTTLVRSVQFSKALGQISTTESGMLMFVKPTHPLKAFPFIALIELGIVEPLQPMINVLVYVSIIALQLSLCFHRK